MALWGNKDSFSDLTGTVTVDYATKIVDGNATTFVTAGISTGDESVFYSHAVRRQKGIRCALERRRDCGRP